MSTHGFTVLERDDREFLIILGACGLGYALLAAALSFVPTPTRSATDVASLPPRIAKLILDAPPAPPALVAPPTTSLETPAAREVEPKPGRVAKKSEAPPPPQPAPPSEEQIRADAEAALAEARLRLEAEAVARREQNRAVAKQSGLLKALSADGGGNGGGEPASLDRVLSDVSVLRNPSLAPTGAGGAGDNLGTGSGSGFGSGAGRLSVDAVVSGLKGQGTGEAVILAGKASTRVDSALVVNGASPTRSDDSIRKVLKGLDAWLKFQYHKAQRDHPGLGVGLTVEFTITPQGDVVNCRVASSTLEYPPLEQTITKRFCLLTFPPLDEGADDEVTTKYLIDFEGFR